MQTMKKLSESHAKDILGEQFKKNPDAVKSIRADFEAGFKAALAIYGTKEKAL